MFRPRRPVHPSPFPPDAPTPSHRPSETFQPLNIPTIQRAPKLSPLDATLIRKPGEGPPLPPLEFYDSLLRTSAPTRHAGALASPILSCISAHFPSQLGVGVCAHLQPQVQLRIPASAPASRFEFRISHPLFHGPLLTSPCVTLRT